MESKEALELQKKWGGKPCDHPHLEKETRMFGPWSGNWVCTQCGAIGRRGFLEDKPTSSD